MRWILLLYLTLLKSGLLSCIKTSRLKGCKASCSTALNSGSFQVSLKGSFLGMCGIVLAMGSLQALTLSEAEEIALSNNPQVKASEELIEMARQGRLRCNLEMAPAAYPPFTRV